MYIHVSDVIQKYLANISTNGPRIPRAGEVFPHGIYNKQRYCDVTLDALCQVADSCRMKELSCEWDRVRSRG